MQFRLPASGVCDCYWVEVSTYTEAPPSLPWAERVEKAAGTAAAGFRSLAKRFDFVTVGREWPELVRLEAAGGSVPDAMWFVWYVVDETEATENGV